jgi:hypothetical protein
MRVMGLLAVVLVGCGGKVRPQAPVLTGWERASAFGVEQGSPAQYAGPPLVAAPVIPFMAFGAVFDIDLVVATKGDWSMHEFVRSALPNGKVRWAVIETRADTGDQVLLAESDAIDLIFPEVALDRYTTKIDVLDESTDAELRVTVRYQNMDDKAVEANFVSKAFGSLERRRNGNTMGHSRNQMLAALDIPYAESAFDANLSVEGKKEAVIKIGGILPFQFAAQQAQGGVSIGNFVVESGATVGWEASPGPVLLGDDGAPVPVAAEAEPPAASSTGETVERPDPAAAPASTGETAVRPPEALPAVPAPPAFGPDGLPVEVDSTAPPVEVPMAPLADFTTTHLMASGNQVRQTWDVDVVGNRVFATTASDERIVRYEYLTRVDAIELSAITVQTYGRAVPAVAIEFSPALPDLRRSFGGHQVSRFVIDVNGQANHATGTVDCWWTEKGVMVKVEPTEPDDAVARKLVSTITLGEGKAAVVTERVD